MLGRKAGTRHGFLNMTSSPVDITEIFTPISSTSDQMMRIQLLIAVLQIAAGQPQTFSFDGIGLSSDIKTVAARYPHSTAQDQDVSLALADIHDHISHIEISGTGKTRRVRIAFETRPDGRRPDYPMCAQIEATLVKQYGRPQAILRFSEEASPRADRVWRSPTEELRLLCFEAPRRRLLAEAVQITPR